MTNIKSLAGPALEFAFEEIVTLEAAPESDVPAVRIRFYKAIWL